MESIKYQQFVCYSLIYFPPVCKSFTNRDGSQSPTRTYNNVYLCFHSYHSTKTVHPFILNTESLTLGSDNIIKFLTEWMGKDIDKDAVKKFTAEDLLRCCQGKRATIGYQGYKIVSVKPADFSQKLAMKEGYHPRFIPKNGKELQLIPLAPKKDHLKYKLDILGNDKNKVGDTIDVIIKEVEPAKFVKCVITEINKHGDDFILTVVEKVGA